MRTHIEGSTPLPDFVPEDSPLNADILSWGGTENGTSILVDFVPDTPEREAPIEEEQPRKPRRNGK